MAIRLRHPCNPLHEKIENLKYDIKGIIMTLGNVNKSRKSYPTKGVIARTVEAARSLNIDVVSIEILPNGSIKVFDARSFTQTENSRDEFEAWNAQGLL